MVLAAVAGEHDALVVAVEHVGADVGDHERRPHQDADVDAAVVVAVDEHHLLVRRAADVGEQAVGEPLQRRAVLGLDDAEDVGADVAHDHRRVPQRQLVGRLRGQLDPADPVGAAVGDDLDGAAAGPAQEPAADDAQPGAAPTSPTAAGRASPAASSIRALRAGGVVGLLEQGVELGVGLEDRPPGRPRAEVEGAGAVEQVLDVERPDPHRPLPWHR